MILKGILANPLTFVVEMLQSASLSQKVGTGKKNHKYKNDTCIAHEWDRWLKEDNNDANARSTERPSNEKNKWVHEVWWGWEEEGSVNNILESILS